MQGPRKPRPGRPGAREALKGHPTARSVTYTLPLPAPVRTPQASQHLLRRRFAAVHDPGDVRDRRVIAVAQPERRTLPRGELAQSKKKLRVQRTTTKRWCWRVPACGQWEPQSTWPTAQAVDDGEEPGSEVT